MSALVLVSATPSGWKHSAEIVAQWEAVDEAYERRGLEAANEIEMKMWLDGPFRAPDVVDRDLRRMAAMVNSVLLERQAAFETEPGDLEPPALGRLSELQVPVLVVTGELDQPTRSPDHWRSLAKPAPNTSRSRMPPTFPISSARPISTGP